jgi:hypothetical protein
MHPAGDLLGFVTRRRMFILRRKPRKHAEIRAAMRAGHAAKRHTGAPAETSMELIHA